MDENNLMTGLISRRYLEPKQVKSSHTIKVFVAFRDDLKFWKICFKFSLNISK